MDQKTKEEKGVFLDIPRLTMENHVDVIRKLCEYSMGLQSEEDERKFIEWARNRFLKKVKEEYPDDEPLSTLLNRMFGMVTFERLLANIFKNIEKKEKRDNIVVVFVNNKKIH